MDQLERDVMQESAFHRGLKCLRSLQVPLERLKLLLDLASPLANIEPTATTVVGLVKGVAAIAISFATADLNFAKQVAEMIEKIPYINDCDMLGQKTARDDIQKVLVMVYRKMLEFYKAAYEMLSRKGTKLIVKMVLERTAFQIMLDVRSMLYDNEIARWLGGGQMSHQCQYHEYLRTVRADPACESLLKISELTNWYDTVDNSQQLVIIGDMGCGKTVAMSFLVDTLVGRSQRRLPKPKLCYYYCRDDKS